MTLYHYIYIGEVLLLLPHPIPWILSLIISVQRHGEQYHADVGGTADGAVH